MKWEMCARYLLDGERWAMRRVVTAKLSSEVCGSIVVCSDLTRGSILVSYPGGAERNR